MSAATDNPEIKKRWPRWLRIFLWVEAVMGVLVLAAVFADTPAQQLRNALIIGAVAYGLYRWLWKQGGQKPEKAPIQLPETTRGK